MSNLKDNLFCSEFACIIGFFLSFFYIKCWGHGGANGFNYLAHDNLREIQYFSFNHVDIVIIIMGNIINNDQILQMPGLRTLSCILDVFVR